MNHILATQFVDTALDFQMVAGLFSSDWLRIPAELRIHTKSKRRKMVMVPAAPAAQHLKAVDTDIAKQLDVGSFLYFTV